MALTLYITQARYEGGHTLNLSFNDGTTHSIDFAPFFLAHPHPQYNKYFDEKRFRQFRIEHGNVVWGKNWDLMFPIAQLHANTLLA